MKGELYSSSFVEEYRNLPLSAILTHGIKVLLGSVLHHNVNEYDVIIILWLNISVNKYTEIIKMVFLCIAHSNKHVYVTK